MAPALRSGRSSEDEGRRGRGRPRKKSEGEDTIYAALHKTITRGLPKGATKHKLTELRAEKVMAFARDNPLVDPSRPPPETWCRHLISMLAQKNWIIKVKDVQTWYAHLPHLFEPNGSSRVSSPASSTSSSGESLFSPAAGGPVHSNPGSISQPVDDQDEIQVLEVIQKKIIPLMLQMNVPRKTKQEVTDEDATPTPIGSQEPPTDELREAVAGPSSGIVTLQTEGVQSPEATSLPPLAALTLEDPAPPAAPINDPAAFLKTIQGTLNDNEASAVKRFLERNNSAISPEFKQLQSSYDAFKEHVSACWKVSSDRNNYANYVHGYENLLHVLQVAEWLMSNCCSF